MPAFSLPLYPPGHPKDEDTAHDEAVQAEIDDDIERRQRALKLADKLRLRARRRPCNPCVCGGRGLCVDAA